MKGLKARFMSAISRLESALRKTRLLSALKMMILKSAQTQQMKPIETRLTRALSS